MIIFGTLLIIKLQWNMLCHVVSYACTIFRHFAIFTFNILFLQVDIRSRFGPFCQLELSHMIDKINISGKQRGGRGFATCYVADSRVHLTSVCGKSKYSGRGGGGSEYCNYLSEYKMSEEENNQNTLFHKYLIFS